MKRLLVLLLVLMMLPLSASSQTDSLSKKENRIWKNLKYDVTVFTKNLGNAFTQPLRWQDDDFIKAGGIALGTSLLYITDSQTRKYFKTQDENAPQILKDFGWYFGSPQNFFMFSGGVYGFGLITNNEKVRRTGVLIISSSVTTGLIQSLTKTIVGRSRPSNGSYNEFSLFSNKSGHHSFPSGHTVLSFTIAHSIAKQLNNFWLKTGVYAIGSIAPISRLWSGAHWLSDVGFSIALSIVVVDNIDNFMKKEKLYQYGQPKQISWRLNAGLGTLGLVGTF